MAQPNTLRKGDKVRINKKVPEDSLTSDEYDIQDEKVIGEVLGRVSVTVVKVTFPETGGTNSTTTVFFDRELDKVEG